MCCSCKLRQCLLQLRASVMLHLAECQARALFQIICKAYALHAGQHGVPAAVLCHSLLQEAFSLFGLHACNKSVWSMMFMPLVAGQT